MKPDLREIDDIIFDLGGVLLNLDFEAAFKAFRALGLSDRVVDYKQAYADPVFYELETGKIDPPAFRSGVRRLLNNPGVTDAEIDHAWCSIILDIPAERVRVIQELTRNFNIFLFSNTNAIHVEKMHAEFRAIHGLEFSSLFVKDYYSHELKERKPDLSSYKKVIRLSGVNPEKTLFVDDLEQNILGAQKAGLKTFWLKNGMELSDLF